MAQEEWKHAIQLFLTYNGAALAGYVDAVSNVVALFVYIVNLFMDDDVTDERTKEVEKLMQIADEKIAETKLDTRQVRTQ